MDITVQVTGLDRLMLANEALLRDMHFGIEMVLREQSLEMRDQMRQVAPVFTGTFLARVSSGVTTKSRVALTFEAAVKAAFVRPRAPHSWLVIHGRRPGKQPSVDPAHAKSPESAQRLRDWAIAKGINPFVLARAIGRRGTVGKPFMGTLIARAEMTFHARVLAMVDRVAARYRAT